MRRKFEYVCALQDRLEAEGPGRQATLFGTRLTRIKPFSEPYDRDGYNDTIISHELVGDFYIYFSITSRANESGAYLRSLTGSSPQSPSAVLTTDRCPGHCSSSAGECISLDHTFKLAKKAVVIDGDGVRLQVMGGGLFTVINEANLILLWVSRRVTCDKSHRVR